MIKSGLMNDDIPTSVEINDEVTDRNCLNCGTYVPETYCTHCGQVYHNNDLSVKSLLKEWYKKQRHHVEVFILTTRHLITQPETVIKSYWAGKRKTYYNPFNYFVLIGSVMSFMMIKFGTFDPETMAQGSNAFNESMGIPANEKAEAMNMEWMQWVQGHFNLVLMFTVPFYAMGLRFLFRKRKHNLGEIMVLHLYAMGLYFLFSLPLIPFIDYSNLFNSPITIVSFVLLFGIWTWFIRQVFDVSWLKAILYTVGMYVIAQVILISATLALLLIALVFILAFKFVQKLFIGT